MSMWDFHFLDARVLVDCAMGRKPADLVILNGRWVCVQSGEIIPNTDIAILGERIAYVGSDAKHTIGPKTLVIDADGAFLSPGLLDGHVHIESGMLTVTEFVRAVIPHGTTGLFIDPHEIANVFGLKGVRLMADEAGNQPIHVFTQIPSCVPSAPGFETPGAEIGPAEVAEALRWSGVIGLGEMMNFPGVFNNDDKVHAEISVTRQKGKTVGGHYASPDLGLPFHAYAAGGAQDDHEGTTARDAVERVRQGMKVMMRCASGWEDVTEQVKAVTEYGQDSRHFLLCTDDCHAETLVNEGHIDRAVRLVMSLGVAPMQAIQMATINTADHFGVSRDMGMIAPGRYADILIINDLEKFKPTMVIARGKLAAQDGEVVAERDHVHHPDWALNSIHLEHPLTAADFVLHAELDGPVTAHVIGVVENLIPTQHRQIPMTAANGQVQADIARDIAKVALVERHHCTGRVQVGLVQGFGLTARCAIASTVVHDSHHMIVVGTDDEQMAIAANALAACGGGQVVVKDGRVIGQVDLPIAGLMSNENAHIVSEKAATVLSGLRACGSTIKNPNMAVSFLGLVVIPELRISDLGLVDVTHFAFIPVVQETGTQRG